MQHLKTARLAVIAVAALLFANAGVADHDDGTTARVKQALVAAGIADAAAIEVATFNGEVDLSGVVRSEHVREEAARVAGVVRGVTAVRNGLEVRQQSGQRAPDDVIADRVREALVATGSAEAQGIDVKIFNVEVDLSGVVGSDDIRETAARAAGEVRGVTAVRNELVVRHP